MLNRNVYKKLFFLSALFMLPCLHVSAASTPVILVDGSPLKTTTSPYIFNDRALVPLRPIFEALGAEVKWQSDTRKITVHKNQTIIQLQIMRTQATVDNQPVTIDAPPLIMDDTTMVPVRFVAQSLGANVDWDRYTNTISITSPPTPTMTPIPVAATAAPTLAQTIGDGSYTAPAIGPEPYGALANQNFVLIKNWDFGMNGTIKSMDDMDKEFVYHDNFNSLANGTKYGSVMVASKPSTALASTSLGPQPVEDPNHPVRSITEDSLKCFLVPLTDDEYINPKEYKVGNGSFTAKFKLPNGGAFLGKDLVWETRVRYKVMEGFWFAIWNCGNKWNRGAEMDIIEAFGYDNGNGHTNFDGRTWHSNCVGGTEWLDYKEWAPDMARGGVTSFDATEYHVWQWLYRKDNTFSVYMDGHEVQKGTLIWTYGAKQDGEQIDMAFLVDAGWGHTSVKSVSNTVHRSIFDDKYYEFDYSRVYLR